MSIMCILCKYNNVVPALIIYSDGTFVFRQAPHLQWGDVGLVQSRAILEYVARKTGALGSTDEDAAR